MSKSSNSEPAAIGNEFTESIKKLKYLKKKSSPKFEIKLMMRNFFLSFLFELL